jgi:DegV family protein with EDD domain
MKTAIVTDSTCDILPNVVAERQIFVTPLHIHWGTENLTDGVDITPDTFYTRLATDPVLPKTSQPAPGEFVDKFKLAREQTGADEIVCIVVSKTLSGTYTSAETAAGVVDFPVKVVDSRNASATLGLLVEYAATLRDRGVSANDIANSVVAMIPNTRIYFLPNTLDYLHKGGRIGNARHLIGSMLSIKPILYLKDGTVQPLESARGRKKAISRLIETLVEFKDKRPLRLGLCHSHPTDLATVRAEIQEQVKPDYFFENVSTPVVGVHLGPEAMGIGLLHGV